MARALRPKSYFRKSHLSVFLIIFAILGIIYLIESLAAPNPNLPGDLNSDNTVNIQDLSVLLSNYNTTNTSADINNDGTVNVLDLSILLSHYGQSISSIPSIPTGLTATAGDGAVALKWNPNASTEGVDTYQVYWTTDSAWGTNNNNLNVTGTGYTLTGLTNGTTYYFRVSAHNTTGYGDWSSAINATPSGGGSSLGSKLPARMPESSGSKTLYVSPSGSGTSCSQSSPCSFDQAWASASSGTIINLIGGNYNGYKSLKSKRYSGTNPVTLQSVPGQTAVFTGCASSCSQNALAFSNTLGIRIRNITITSPNNLGAGLKFENASYMEADHLYLHNVCGNGIMVGGVTQSGDVQTYNDHVQIWNSTITMDGSCGNDGAGPHGIYMGGGSEFDNTKHGVDGFVIANTVIYDQPTGFALQVGDQAVNGFVVNNTFDHSYVPVSYQGSAVVVWGAGPYKTANVVIANNILTNNSAHAIQPDCPSSGLVGISIFNNLAYANAQTPSYYDYYGVRCYTSGTNLPDANPLYANRTGHDFHISSSSPGFGKADPAYTPPYDHDGNVRNAAPNLGAY